MTAPMPSEVNAWSTPRIMVSMPCLTLEPEVQGKLACKHCYNRTGWENHLLLWDENVQSGEEKAELRQP